MSRNSPRKPRVSIYPFKNEHILNNTSEKIEHRIKALIETWGELGSLKSCPSRENLKNLSEYVKSHTLNIVLSASWLKYQSKYYLRLGEAITKCANFQIFQNHKSFQKLCRKLACILQAPWQKSTIIKMLNCTNPNTQIEDYNFFVHEESGYFISMRLKKLCEDKCEDMALNLTRAYIKCCEWADMYSKDMCITEDQRKFVFDVYLALLYKLNCTSEMSSFLKKVSLPEGVDMVKRFSIKIVSASRIWVNSVRVAQLSATIFLTRGVMQPYEETAIFLNKLLEVWLPTYETDVDYEELVECLKRIIKNALTASHMYLFCKQLSNKFGVKLRSYNVEIYIQALNTDLNMLEKLKTENEEEKFKETSSRVADGLLCLANLLVENLNVARECILSAFSLKPTESCFRQVEDAARASGYHVLDTGQWKCKFHPPAKPDDELLIICENCNDFMSELKINPALQQPNTALTEALNTNNMGLNEQICDDLVVIIFCARYQLLSWLQNWDDLHRLSVMYLHDPDKTKNLITELKFIEKDYTQFLIKREMECAEPYESHVDRDIFEEYIECKRKKKRKRIGSYDEDYDESQDFLYTPNARKLDSEESQTLRSFRRSLKKIEQPTIQWYDTSQTTESSSQSSSSVTSSSPIPFSESTVPMSGVQIRKDLYKDPSFGSHFHSDNDSLNIIQSNTLFRLNENFSEQPVIQIAEEQANKVETRVHENLDNGADINVKQDEDSDSSLHFPYDLLHRKKEDLDSTDEGIEEMEREVFQEDEIFYSNYMRTFPIINNNLIKTPPLLDDKTVNIDCVKNNMDCEKDSLINKDFSDGKAHKTLINMKDCKKSIDSAITESSQDLNYKEKYNLKECSVMLNRIREPFNKNLVLKQKIPHKRRVCNTKTRPKRKIKVFSDNNKTSENTVQSVPTKDENFNFKYNVPIKPPRSVLSANNTDGVLEALKKKLLVSSDKMNPRVILQRLEESCIKSLLGGVPGIKDTNLFRPENTDRIVNVVQVAGGRATSTVPAPNTQTSTQVSPHIQRIGQPRSEKTEQSNSETSSSPNTKPSNTYTITKPAATQSPTLINILSQQVIRPSPSNNNTRTRGGPLINILSQQTIKQSNTTATPKATTTTTVTSESQGNIAPRIIATSSEQQIINQIVNPSRTTGPLKTVVGTSNSEQGRIVQFICKSTDGKLIPVTSFPSNRLVKVATTQAVTAPDSPNLEDSFTKAAKKTDSNEISETLPKFQQAFGKSVYQNNVDSTNSSTNNINTNVNADIEKNKNQIKTSSVSVQPIQGGVIYTRQMPVGQTINLIPQTRGQVFRIATTNPEQISLVKDTVIHSKMSALLAAALQGKPKNDADAENTTENATTTSSNTTRVQLTRPTLVQNARIVKPVLQIPSNVIRNAPQTNLSSTTLEQLREFDMVYKQVKERSSTSTPAESSTATESNESSPQRISVTYLNQTQKLNCAPVVVVSSYSNLQPAASPALSVASQGSSSPCITPAPTPTPVLPKVAVKGSKGKTVKNAPMHASKTSPIPKPQQKPQEDEHTTQRIFDILAEYAEQLRNSPDLNNKPAPRRRSNPPTNPSQNSKRKKSSSKKSGQCSSLSTDADIDDPRTVGSEDSSCGVVQLSMQDEEQTPTTASTSESNDSTTTSRQQLILTDSTHNQTRNLIIADSSVGEALKMPNTAVLVPGNYIMPVSMVKGGQQIAVVSGGSKILATVPARSGPNMLLFQSFLNQNRKSSVPTVKYSTIQPISGISSQTLTGVNAQSPVILPPPSHGISTVTLGQPIAIKKIEDSDRVNTELLLTISQSRENNCTTTEDTPQPDSSTSVVPKIESDLDENTAMSDNSSEKTFSYQKPLISKTPIATPVIAQNIKEELTDEQTDSTTTQTIMTLNINPLEIKGEVKSEERVQSVLVTAGSSNGPMLSHSPPLYKQSDCSRTNEQTKDEFLRNGGKRNEKVQQNTVFCMQGKVKKAASSGRMDRDVHQICMRRQAALERELRLQKSLSEECEDLGVDEPSTSDLFPEALLFDANISPSFDQTSQDLVKRPVQAQEKEESKLTLFSDDDFMFETNQYPSSDNQLCYEEVVENRMLANGQNSAEPPCEDTTLLQTCTSMSDVTLSSPISPDTYHPHNSPPLNKYMHKYTNKKKNDRKQVDNWPAEVSSSEDTTGSNELVKCSSSPELCMNKRSDEELSDGSFKVVRLSISKTECGDVNCINDADSISGRGARKSVKKMCSCCNGTEENAISRKRPSTQQHTNNPHKKAFPNKKR